MEQLYRKLPAIQTGPEESQPQTLWMLGIRMVLPASVGVPGKILEKRGGGHLAGSIGNGTGFYDALMSKGISRRTFLKYCGGLAVALGMSEAMAPKVADALENEAIGASEGNLAPVIWMEGASCSGCTESFAQINEPDVASVVLDMISLNYSECLGAGAGWSFEQAKEETIEAGGYVLVYEGAVVTGWNGNALRVADEKGTVALVEAAESAVAVIAMGSCSCDGGWVAAYPNTSEAMGVQKYLKQQGVSTPVVNIPGCPGNPDNLMAVITQFLLDGTLPTLTSNNMPKEMFGQTIHDNCPRRGHFENGEFVYHFGSEAEEKGYCLYAMGCKGPQTYANCPEIRWNSKTSWCVEAGAPCIGCCQADPSMTDSNWVDVNSPFIESRFRDINLGGFRFKSQTAGLAITGVIVVCIGVHAYAMKKTGRTTHGAPIEKESDYERRQRLRNGEPGAKANDLNQQAEDLESREDQRNDKRNQMADKAVENSKTRKEKAAAEGQYPAAATVKTDDSNATGQANDLKQQAEDLESREEQRNDKRNQMADKAIGNSEKRKENAENAKKGGER